MTLGTLRDPTSTLAVLHVHSGNRWGGIESMLVTIARHERAVSAMQSEFALCFDGALAAALASAGATVHALPRTRLSRPLTRWRASRQLAALLAARRPHVVVVHSGWTLAAFRGVLASSRIPWVRWLHSPAAEPKWTSGILRSTRPALVIFNSHFTRREWPGRDAAVPEAVCYCPLDPGPPGRERQAIRRALGLSAATVVLIIAARMERWKGHTTLIGALARLGAHLDWACLVAGGAQSGAEAAYEAELRQDAARRGLSERVLFLGHRSDVADLLAAADICCQPNSGPEPFGLSLVEALAAGLPVVTTRLGAAAEVIDDTCGVLVPAGDEAALAGVLAHLIATPAERERLGAGGPGRARVLCGVDVRIPEVAALLASAQARGERTT